MKCFHCDRCGKKLPSIHLLMLRTGRIMDDNTISLDTIPLKA